MHERDSQRSAGQRNNREHTHRTTRPHAHRARLQSTQTNQDSQPSNRPRACSRHRHKYSGSTGVLTCFTQAEDIQLASRLVPSSPSPLPRIKGRGLPCLRPPTAAFVATVTTGPIEHQPSTSTCPGCTSGTQWQNPCWGRHQGSLSSARLQWLITRAPWMGILKHLCPTH